MFEIWNTASATRAVRVGVVSGASSDDFAFGAVTINESSEATLEAVVEAAYLAIFDFLDATGFIAPVRFWNYLTAISGDDRGLERYMRFNIGRQNAFTARLRQPVPPAASALGAYRGPSIIYVLATRQTPTPVENPRQISAYAYPPIYGPRSPSFSRASLLAPDTLFISGTASIVGHETLHAGDLPAQIAETVENLRVLIGAAKHCASFPFGAGWALKIYLRDPAHGAEVDHAINALFGETSQRLYLAAEICRRDLLLEIEAFCNLGTPAGTLAIELPRTAPKIEHKTNKGNSMTGKQTPTASNTIKNPDNWTSGDEPMTGAQSSYLHTLADQAGEPDEAAADLTKAEASKRIDHLRQEVGLAGGKKGG